MKICGLITEYHPFHNGHLYHYEKAKKESGADFCIAVMSGNYVQRGTPAMIDKYTRARMALSAGVDVVLELPSIFSTASAELFAYGGVSLLHSLSCVDSICFGSESGNLSILQEIALLLADEPEEYKKLLKEKCKEGLSFPKAREQALLSFLPDFTDIYGQDTDFLMHPNNILAIEYLKSLYKLQSSIIPLTIPRLGNQYHDINLPLSPINVGKGSTLCSATALRNCLKDLKRCESDADIDSLLSISPYIPDEAFSVLLKHLELQQIIVPDDINEMLYYALWEHYSNGYTEFADITKELSDRIHNTIYQYTGFEQYCELLKTKDLTYSRISRCLLHILLHITKEEVNDSLSNDHPVPYCRLLGFRKDAKEVLTAISSQSSIPLISKLADYKSILPESAQKILEEEIRRDHIYNSITALRNGQNMVNEFTRQMIVI